jgi:ABC-type branched-subunit amino acid transport system substrate-binding protein
MLRQLITLLLVAIVGGHAFAIEVDQRPEIVVGMLVPSDDARRPAGEAVESGIQALFDRVNRHGGVRGHRLRLAVKHYPGGPEHAMQAVFDLLDTHGIQALLSPVGCSSTQATMPIAEAAGLAVIAPLCADDNLRRPVSVAFLTGVGHGEQTVRLVEHLLDGGARRIGLLTSEDSHGLAVRRHALDTLARHGLADAALPDAAAEHVNKSSDESPRSPTDAIVLAVADEHLEATISRLRHAGFEGEIGIVPRSDALTVPTTDAPWTGSTLVSEPEPPAGADSLAARACRRLLEAVPAAGPPLAAEHGCMAAQLLLAGLRRLHELPFEPGALISALERPGRADSRASAHAAGFTAFDHQLNTAVSIRPLSLPSRLSLDQLRP